MKIKGEIKQDNEVHRYCPRCWSENTTSYFRQGKGYYRCNDCGYDDSRLVIIYPQMRFRVMDDNELLHFSVGCVLEWKRMFFLFRRRFYPYRYTIVAGHWDMSDLTPELAVAREIQEETGFELYPEHPIFVETLNDPCYRGADYHKWYLYRASASDNRATMSEEANVIGWYSPDEIRKLKLTFPTEYFFKKLQIIF